MSTRWNVVSVLLVVLPRLSEGLKLTCEIPSVEAGDDATLTINFGEDLSKEKSVDFSILHFKDIATVSQMLSCHFTHGMVECDNRTSYTWDRQATDVFRVYIHNVSQELEGNILVHFDPLYVKYQDHCYFALKAPTCQTDILNVSNSRMSCTTQLLPIGQTCNVTCNYNHYFQDNQISMTYTCNGKNKWSPEVPIKFCEERERGQETLNVYYTPFFLYTMLLSSILLIFIMFLLLQCYVLRIKLRTPKECAYEEYDEGILLNSISTEVKLRDPASQQSEEDYWLQCIKTWYPELQSQTYFLPPLHFTGVMYNLRIDAGHQVLVPKAIQDYDQQNDRALQRVLQCFCALAHKQKEVMIVISQLQFGKYLGEPSYAPAATLLLQHSSLHKHHYDKGVCDILIIHKEIGLLTLEIKNVEGNFKEQEMTEQEQDDVVMEKVKQAVKQLNKTEVILKKLISDISATINITKLLVLPNISSSQLLRTINTTRENQQLCTCLGVQSVDDAMNRCLLSDQLSNKCMPSDKFHSLHQVFEEWWLHAMKSGPKNIMTSLVYEQLVARFCGPVTTVEVHCVTAPRLNIRTLGKAVSETGDRLARLVLFPQQVDILNRSPPWTFLTGPPGTGKTIVLIIQGLTWIQRGYDVHVVSTCYGSRAATIVIKHQLQETAKTSSVISRVYRHQFDFLKNEEVKIAVRYLKSLSNKRHLCVIADEVLHDYRESFQTFCDQLIREVTEVYIWGASVHHDIRPLCLEEVILTTPIRSPPDVVREVMSADEILRKQVHDYTAIEVPFPTEETAVFRIKHRDGLLGHNEFWPRDCVECGHQVADVLKNLYVGSKGDSNGHPPLQYRDVMVLCNYYPTDRMTTTGLIRGLRDRHVPVRVVEKGDDAAIRDTALGVGDLVTVANWNAVYGLERKVIIVESGFGVFSERLYAMSRCTSKLVLIDY